MKKFFWLEQIRKNNKPWGEVKISKNKKNKNKKNKKI